MRADLTTTGTPSPTAAAHPLFAAAWLGLVLASYAILKPIRDAMSTAAGTGDVDVALLWTFTFAGTLLVAPLFAAAAARMPRGKLVARTFHVIAGCLLVFFAAWRWSDPESRLWIGRAFYVFVSVFNLFTVAVFWCATTDAFDHGRAVRQFGPIAIGGTLGMFAGTEITRQLARQLDTSTFLLLSAALLELGLLCALPVLRQRAGEGLTLQVPRGRDALRDLRAVIDSPMLWRLAVYVVLMTFPAAVFYQETRHLVAGSGLDEAQRKALYATANEITQGFTLLAQGFVVGPLIRRFGLRVGLAVLPAVSTVAFLALGIASWSGVSLFWTQLVANSAVEAMRHAVQKPSREVLFTLTEPHERYAAKNVIDTVAHRGGDVASVFAHHGLTLLNGSLHFVLLAVVPVSLGWSALGARLGTRADRRARSRDA